MSVRHWQLERRITAEYSRYIYNALGHYFGNWTHASFLGVPQWLEKYALQAAQKMVYQAGELNARTWQKAAREAQAGQQMYAALKEEMQGPVGRRYYQLIRHNAQLISSLPAEVAKLVTVRVARHEQTGERAISALLPGPSPATEPAIAPLLRTVARTRAALIARTETSKATTALTRARSDVFGVQWYVWETSRDQRVRHSHYKMQGVLVPWNDAPSPEQLFGPGKMVGRYHAGDIFNCRCYPAPLIRLDQVTWPHRVYWAGVIHYMTLATFRNITNIQQPLAA